MRSKRSIADVGEEEQQGMQLAMPTLSGTIRDATGGTNKRRRVSKDLEDAEVRNEEDEEVAEEEGGGGGGGGGEGGDEAREELHQRNFHDRSYDNANDIDAILQPLAVPTQNPQKTRQAYRKMLVYLDTNKKEALKGNSDVLEQLVDKANVLIEAGEVKSTQEATLDSRFFVEIGALGVQRAQLMRREAAGFDMTDFICGLQAKMGSSRPGLVAEGEDEEDEIAALGPLNWDVLQMMSAKYSLKAPTIGFMFGPMAVEFTEKPRKERVIRQKSARAEVQRPQEIHQQGTKGRDQTTQRMVREAHAVLSGEGGMCQYYQFVVNPHSFAQTVENVFHVAFLINEKIAGLTEEHGELVLYLSGAGEDEEAEFGGRRKQLMMEMDHDIWRGMIARYDIKQSKIPHRNVDK
ncbi:hypothetical protein SeLEV6574_g02670 [Synchytrium endobioticum]|uniref:Non-structural maintenance of chromosomes element 4 n=1 Tax=Synchytrium endobioticum TaxID=286115 RepID=A0A507D7X2_9FUNG|nr:hypothetical protein SeLEV6574_g02670 [Synchytrium endobioticum]